MTVIAWDGSTLAADKMISCGDTIMTIRKLRRVPLDDGTDCAVSYCGGVTEGIQLFEWFCSGADPDLFPVVTQGSSLIVAYADGTCYEYEGDATPIPVEDNHCAWGSGMQYAMGAMAAGADAVQAIQHTNYLSSSCGRGIDSICLRQSSES